IGGSSPARGAARVVPRGEMSQILPLPSSVTKSVPSCATATPTGRPQTSLSETTKPVMKSSTSCRFPRIAKQEPDDLITGALRSVPGAVQRDEGTASIRGREVGAVIELLPAHGLFA